MVGSDVYPGAKTNYRSDIGATERWLRKWPIIEREWEICFLRCLGRDEPVAVNVGGKIDLFPTTNQ